MSNWETLAVAAVLGACAGGFATASHYRLAIAEAEAQAQERIAKQEKESYEIYQKQQEALAEALAARDKALRSVASLRADARRVRERADLRAASDESGGAGNRAAERLGQCERLLGEGAELVGEGAELSVRVAADKEALAAAAGSAN